MHYINLSVNIYEYDLIVVLKIETLLHRQNFIYAHLFKLTSTEFVLRTHLVSFDFTYFSFLLFNT